MRQQKKDPACCAVCYVRVSTDEQVKEGVSLSAQEERVLSYCRMHELHVVEVVREEGVSGGKPLYLRPAGVAIHNLILQGAVKHVVAYRLDRLFRDIIDALSITKEWDKLGVSLHLVDMGGQAINTNTAMGRFFMSTMAGVAELERNLIAERIAMSMKYKKKSYQIYSRVPFGFKREGDALVPDPKEIEWVKFIFEKRQAGWSLRDIASWLNVMRVPVKGKGKKWYACTVRYILQNDLYEEFVDQTNIKQEAPSLF
ncbi:recombinase family protein [Thermovirga lienii]|uniref:recombinase family protein n=1 Tax=Thermovirga lienii TaxID=336261 RepID=UPI002FE23EA9